MRVKKKNRGKIRGDWRIDNEKNIMFFFSRLPLKELFPRYFLDISASEANSGTKRKEKNRC